jgi:hypothetical protein
VAGGDEHLSDADLAAFADGSLPQVRQAHVAARVERSRRLRILVDEQRVALDAVRALEVTAPARLHGRLRGLSVVR